VLGGLAVDRSPQYVSTTGAGEPRGLVRAGFTVWGLPWASALGKVSFQPARSTPAGAASAAPSELGALAGSVTLGPVTLAPVTLGPVVLGAAGCGVEPEQPDVATTNNMTRPTHPTRLGYRK
jgi:hypothetical protein